MEKENQNKLYKFEKLSEKNEQNSFLNEQFNPVNSKLL
jgi:hypothetical protein